MSEQNNAPKKRGPKSVRSKGKVKAEFEGYPVGRNGTVVDPEQVRKLAALGCKNIEIANFFGVHDEAITRIFEPELTLGREELKITLRRAMLENAVTKMNPALQIFLAKNILGMSDSPVTTVEKLPLPWNDDIDKPIKGHEFGGDDDLDATE